MPSRRRSRNKSISGNISDVQKRLRYLETRPAPSQLARKVVATQNIALRAIMPEVVADAAIVRRTLAPESVISANLSVVGDPDGAAVATENVQDVSITNEKLAGEIEDDKIVGISASKIGPDLLQDDQIDGISASKIGPDLLQDDQLAGIDTGKLIGTVLADQLAGGITFDQIDSVDAATITEGLIMDEQIDGISGEKIIGGIDGALIIAESIPAEALELDSITEFQIASDAIGFDELQGNTVDTVHIRENAVGSFELADLAVERRHVSDNVIIDRMVNAGAIQTRGIQNLAVTTAKIADGAVTAAKLGSINAAVNASLTTLGSAIGKSFPVQGLVAITLSVSSGASSVAAGNHTHGQAGYTAAGSTGVPSHTHSVSGSTGSGGAHTGHGGHSHSFSATSGTPSTLKLKKEITDYQMVDVKNILNLNLKRYKYKNQARNLQEGREWMYGYIAEEVQELGIEEIVGYDENKEPNAINYGLLSTLVLELVKVQQTEIDSLREEIQRLKEKI